MKKIENDNRIHREYVQKKYSIAYVAQNNLARNN